MSTVIDFQSLAGTKSNWKLLQQIHDVLLSTSKNIEYHTFPIYIRYVDDDKNIALLYFRAKHLKPNEVELGLNIGIAKCPQGFNDGKHMKYPGINCSIKLKTSTHLTKQLLDALELTKQ